jgi:hypothetical protein
MSNPTTKGTQYVVMVMVGIIFTVCITVAAPEGYEPPLYHHIIPVGDYIQFLGDFALYYSGVTYEGNHTILVLGLTAVGDHKTYYYPYEQEPFNLTFTHQPYTVHLINCSITDNNLSYWSDNP